ncbi:hypothetical protein O6H91_07G060900 [Diphasiastrum complanatum]|uniref:Uncharacterized protein n=1 Tax=Diphasiastrum complanatum TaxID=34168 RepID=A0ACC2D5Q8_DIPCM|nr:hypothetical protein O6H91_07G060900 [Diphasiastrum complanatum]
MQTIDAMLFVIILMRFSLKCIQPLARMGAQVTGIDAVEKNIIVASLHAAKDPLTSSINYSCSTAEQLVQEQQRFDVVTALEVIEHVADPKEFCSSLTSLLKPDGVVVISTINRSISAYGLAIVAAEYILGWLPKGTHDWFKLITPEELALLADHSSLKVQEMAGMVYNPLVGTWSLSDDLNVNYITWMTKSST